MTSDSRQGESRKPGAFSIDDPKVSISEEQSIDVNEFDTVDDAISGDVAQYEPRKGIGWFSIMLSAIGGLLFVSLMLWITSFVTTLFFRQDWIGWLSLGLLALAVFAGVMIVVREFISLVRLKKLGESKQEAERAIEDSDLVRSRSVVKGLETLFSGRKDLLWRFSRFNEQKKDVLDADNLLILAERELLTDLDKQAQGIVASSARRVALLTTLGPAAAFDVAVVGYMNLVMLRRLAMLYGGRPGLIGLFKLGRMVITHLTLAGGLALTSDALQQFMGQKLAAKLSARLGEGLFNGTMTARIGLAAIEVCRPLPFMELKKPSIREFATALFKGDSKS